MPRIKTGLAFHLHHEVLIEFCTNYNQRVSYITRFKDSNEQERRLKLFKIIPIKKLPKDIRIIVSRMNKIITSANSLSREEKRVWLSGDRTKSGKIFSDIDSLYKELRKLDADLQSTKNKKVLERLHGELCPNCPWDGNTIFPKPKLIFPDRNRIRYYLKDNINE